MNVDIDEFLKICIDCIIKCQQCSMYSLGRYETGSCSRITDECAKICSLISYFIKHDVENYLKLLPVCINMCNISSDECNKFSYDFTTDCSRACMKMSIYCRKILSEGKNNTVGKKKLISA